MKTSEFIRAAVDNYLAVTLEEYDGKRKCRGICACLDKLDPASEQRNAIALMIQEEVDGNGFLLFAAFDKEEFKEQQCIRFMYSEFLALYFEDQGD